jgi:hypothetical protein
MFGEDLGANGTNPPGKSTGSLPSGAGMTPVAERSREIEEKAEGLDEPEPGPTVADCIV